MNAEIPTHSVSPATTSNALEAVLQQVLDEIQRRAFPGGLSHSDILLNAEAMETNWGRNLLLSYCMRFMQIMAEDERFKKHGWLMLSNGMGASAFLPGGASSQLLDKLARIGSVTAAITWLEQIVLTKDAVGHVISPAWGVLVDTPIQLTEDVQLVPITSLAPTSQLLKVIGNSSMIDPTHVAPQAAFVTQMHIPEPFFFEDMTKQASMVGAAITPQYEIAMALSCIGPRPIFIAKTWFDYCDPDMQLVTKGSASSTWMPREFLPTHHLPGHYMTDAEGKAAPEFIAKYLSLNKDLKDRMNVAISRLKQAHLRSDIGDKAVELAIAFESLTGDQGPSEMTHKISIRTARYLKDTEAERLQIFTAIKKLYDIRSKLVHTGRVKHKDGQTATVEFCTQLCADLIRKLVTAGQVPNWTSFDLA